MDFLLKVRQARELTSAYVIETPLVHSKKLSAKVERDVWLKLENKQITNSFKLRPAFNAILSHLDEAKARGVITTSSGNYAQAVAYAAEKLGVRATIVMTKATAKNKVEKTKKHGATIVFCENTFESRFEMLDLIQKKEGQLILHGFDSEETICGNGTIALELREQLPEPFSVFCPASGGGLISGIAATLKETGSAYEVFGFQPAVGGAIVKSLQVGHRVNVGPFSTIADALVASIPGERTFQYIQKYVDDFFTVTEEEINDALAFLVDEPLLHPIEPGGIVSVAGMLRTFMKSKNKNLVCVVSGGNKD